MNAKLTRKISLKVVLKTVRFGDCHLVPNTETIDHKHISQSSEHPRMSVQVSCAQSLQLQHWTQSCKAMLCRFMFCWLTCFNQRTAIPLCCVVRFFRSSSCCWLTLYFCRSYIHRRIFSFSFFCVLILDQRKEFDLF